jgi:glycine oxidase
VVSRGDGRVVVGATVEEQGFDTTVTAGGVHDLLRAAVELLPEVTELELTETVAGLRPGSPDNAPLIGPSSLEGLVIASGHYRNGILLVPVTADSIAGVLAGGPVPDLIAPFSPDRFAPPVAGVPAAHAAETGPPRVDHPGGGATAGGVGGAGPAGGVGGAAPAGGPSAGGGPA